MLRGLRTFKGPYADGSQRGGAGRNLILTPLDYYHSKVHQMNERTEGRSCVRESNVDERMNAKQAYNADSGVAHQ